MTDSSRAPFLDLRGRTALVTGAGGGIGLGIASALAAAGAQVAVNDRDAEAAHRSAERIGGRAFPTPGDVSDEGAAEAVVRDTIAFAGRLDILVNNAGVGGEIASIRQQHPAIWQQVIDVNLRGPYLMSRAAIGALQAAPAGAIVNIASIAGLAPFPGSHAYGVSKAGLVMMTKTMATEFAPYGVRVNAVAPGVIDAPMFHDLTNDGDRADLFVSRVPLGRLGTVDDVGASVTFLASEAASYITGVVLPVDGGWAAFGGAGLPRRPSKAEHQG